MSERRSELSVAAQPFQPKVRSPSANKVHLAFEDPGRSPVPRSWLAQPPRAARGAEMATASMHRAAPGTQADELRWIRVNFPGYARLLPRDTRGLPPLRLQCSLLTAVHAELL